MRTLKNSQNFIKDKNLVRRLIQQSKITKKDTVIEIGAGTGAITEELAKVAGRVVAFEVDTELFKYLSAHLSDKYSNLKLVRDNFLNCKLPTKGKYKIFANIPFNLTSVITKKITSSKNPPTDSFLFMQKEAQET